MGDSAKALPAKSEVPTTPDQIRALVKRARAGDETTVPVVRELLQNPRMIPVFGGHLAEQVIDAFAQAMAEKDVGFREALRRKLDLMRADLLGPDPTPVERLLVERVLASWVQVQDAEMRAAQGQKDAAIRQIDFFQRRMDATHRRYLAALKTLALVRKLAVPALQINVAKKQVNVVNPPA